MNKRGRNKVQNPYTIQDIYLSYVEKYPEGSVYYLTYQEYKEITTSYFKYLSEQIVEKSLTISLPFRLGNISVEKYCASYKSLKNMPIDWVRSKELKKQVRLFNEHSNGFKYRFHWDRKNCMIDNKTAYIFQPTRSNKRRVAKLVKTRENDYFEKV